MNHLKTYCKLIRKAEKRNWNKKTSPCYIEGHHIFPLSIFKKDRKKKSMLIKISGGSIKINFQS